jgi:pyruvate dehydrogenase E2 component (dihydrolipoamide acetyltransferase)
MTLHAISVPKWGLAMEEGTLATWLVAEGTSVAPGQEIAEIETSKIANVLEAQVAGVLRRRLAAEGDVRATGALIGVIADADEDEAEIDAFVADYESRLEAEEEKGVSAPVPESIEVGGHAFRFLRAAAKSDDPAAPIVLIHGFGGDLLNWMFNQAELASDRDVYAIDLPGHGGSSKHVGGGSIDELAARVASWMDQLSLRGAHLVGHSMGAAVAVRLASMGGGRVRSVIAICGAGIAGNLNRDYVEGFHAAQKRKDLKPFAEMLFANPDLVTRDMLEGLIAYKRIDGVAEALRLLIDNGLGDASLAAIEVEARTLAVPLLSICGDKDQVVTGASAIDGATVLAGAGHMPHLELAGDVNGRIAAFVRQHD